jgi:Cadherin-like domain/Cadherin-like beta sandwich domain
VGFNFFPLFLKSPSRNEHGSQQDTFRSVNMLTYPPLTPPLSASASPQPTAPVFSVGRFFRRALTCLGIAFGLLAPAAQAGQAAANQPVNIMLAGTAAQSVNPPMDGSDFFVSSIAAISGSPQIIADFSTSKTLVVTVSAQPGQAIRVTPEAGDTERVFSLTIQARSNVASTVQTAKPTLDSAVWENPTGTPPPLSAIDAFFSDYDYGVTPHKFALNLQMRDLAAFSFTKLTLSFTFPQAANAAFNLAAAYTSFGYSAKSPDGNSAPRISFSTPISAPTVTTPTSANIAATTATLGGNATAENTSPITERGVVYSLTSANADPLISGTGVTKVTASGTSLGVFTVPVTGLTTGGAYSFKAYATSGTGTGYTSVATFSYAPEIAVEQPAGTDLTSGTATVAFGNALIGTSIAKTFTVKNTGASALTLGAITFTGANATDFTVTTPPVSPVAASTGSTTFTVTYRASATGAASATLNLPNNDTTGSEAPFLISLSGTGTATGVIASFASPGSVTGGWEQQDAFTIGSVGTANPGNNWPAAESPDKATDGNVDTKFLIFQSNNAGLVLRPANATIAYNRLSLTTANDGPERDPASFRLYGLATAPATTSGNQIQGGRTVIASGTLNLPGARKAGPTVVQFDNTTAYAAYLLIFDSVKNSTITNLTQIAEVKLSQGVTVPNQVAVGAAHGGTLSSTAGTLSFLPGTIRQSGDPEGNNWPAAESPDHAVDGDATTKYLHFTGPNAALGIQPRGGPAVINSVSFFTAGDVPERDPASYVVYGNSSVAAFDGGSGQGLWIQVGSGTLALPSTRNSGPVTVTFPNTVAYQSYAVVFPTVKNVPFETLTTQIGEIAFANVPTNAAPTNITLSNSTIPENNAANATIGTLTATDPNAGDTHTFSLDTRMPDAAAFTITGNTLKINASADFETKSSYAIRILATDSGAGNLSFFKDFTVTITDVTIPQSITFASLANKTFGDAPFTLSATGGASGQPVIFSIESGPATISGNTVTLTGYGSVGVRATQAGAGDYGTAPYVVQGFYVKPQPQVITFAPLANKTFGDASFTVSATGGASGQPVIFSIPGGPASVLGNTVTLTGAGTVTVRATQAGGGNYDPATQVDQSFTVAKAPQTITFNPATTALTTDTVTLSATGGPSGYQVYFSVFSGPGTISGNSLTFTGPGAVVVRAYQFGDSNYLNAADVQRTITAAVPVTAPVISSPTAASITATSAIMGGTVTADGGSAITGYGIVYSLTSVNANPLINGTGVTKSAIVNFSGAYPTGPISLTTFFLTPSSGYSFKIYATNNVGTSYSPVATFTTSAAGETITIGGTTVLSAANIGNAATVPELLTGTTLITGTVNATDTQDRINFTLPPGKAVISGSLAVTNYVAPIPPPSGSPFISNSVLFNSTSAFNTTATAQTTTTVAVTAPTRCNTNTFRVSIDAPVDVRQQFANSGPPSFFPIFVGFLTGYGSASYTLTLEIGDQKTDSTLNNLAGVNGTVISPAYAPATTVYTSTIPFAQTRVDLTRTFGPLQYATQRVNGGAATVIGSGGGNVFGMNVGLNTIATTVCAQNGTETTYTVNVTREPAPNLPPTFSGYAFSTPKDTSASVAVAKILARAADSDGGTLSITSVSPTSGQGGPVSLSGGTVSYSPQNNYTGLDTFTVTISDGQGGSVIGTVTVNVTAGTGGTLNQAKITVLPGGNVALLFQGIPGEHYEIQRSTDLLNWSTLTTVDAAPDGTIPYTDAIPPPGGSAFYRTAVSQG